MSTAESIPLLQPKPKDVNVVGIRNKTTVRGILILLTAITIPVFFLYKSTHTTTSNVLSDIISSADYDTPKPMMKAAWSSVAQPFSTLNPMDLGVIGIDRPAMSRPGAIFDQFFLKNRPLPTNSWLESLFLGKHNDGPNNRVFQVPYIVDTNGFIQGVRAHPPNMLANIREVVMTFEANNGLGLGAVESFSPQHHLYHENTQTHGVARLSAVLQWTRSPSLIDKTEKVPRMRAAIVRGSPYLSMEYLNSTPRVYIQRAVSTDVIVDSSTVLKCGSVPGEFSETPVLVTSDLTLQFQVSDATWVVFVSEPTFFVCSNVVANRSIVVDVQKEGWELKSDYFDLRAISPMEHGMLRAAMTNNCSTGRNPVTCDKLGVARDSTEFTKILRDHADIYPTGECDINFVFPVTSTQEEELRLQFNWKAASMKGLKDPSDIISSEAPELIMYGLPHHQERVKPIVGSTNEVLKNACAATIHGPACLIKGGVWSLVEHMHRIGFNAPRPPRPEMVAEIRRALNNDLKYRLPTNYVYGAGDTYFSGKMLSKLGRILLIAEEVGNYDAVLFKNALIHLQEGLEVWLNGSALSPFLYDRDWGGMVTCGCNFNETTKTCSNRYPDCPALVDAGFNFGAGFYNDHHFHYGYHIYAAAVAAHFNPVWGRRYHEHVLLLIRDIANPSAGDPFFPTWRHKDWYLGSSWASGIATINGEPYPNGRNQESSSESISAYEGVALYGEVASQMYYDSANPDDEALMENARRIRHMGRLLMATEIRTAQTYWHVRASGPNVTRIYPEVYKSKVVGMLWNMLAQEQTWFGNETYKAYGIQLMPLTPAAEQRDTVDWVREMLPVFNASCLIDTHCERDGWSILVLSTQATAGDWRGAWEGLNALDDSVYDSAGGNGHSRSNTLWYIATRPYDPLDKSVTPSTQTTTMKSSRSSVN